MQLTLINQTHAALLYRRRLSASRSQCVALKSISRYESAGGGGLCLETAYIGVFRISDRQWPGLGRCGGMSHRRRQRHERHPVTSCGGSLEYSGRGTWDSMTFLGIVRQSQRRSRTRNSDPSLPHFLPVFPQILTRPTHEHSRAGQYKERRNLVKPNRTGSVPSYLASVNS